MEQTSSAVSHSSNKSEFLVSGKYRLVRKIGSGSFGDIYLGINVTNGEVSFAFLKKEFVYSRLRNTKIGHEPSNGQLNSVYLEGRIKLLLNQEKGQSCKKCKIFQVNLF